MSKFVDLSFYEKRLWKKKIKLIAGVDEAGRGPLAGPVVAAAVIFSPFEEVNGIGDSKQFSPRRREELFKVIDQKAYDWSIGIVDEKTIDRINILEASRLAMQKAVQGLKNLPQFLLIDAVRLPALKVPQEAIIKGDSLSFSIGAASIVAKVLRDELMEKYHHLFPEYGFNQHFGYPTKQHLEALSKFGPCKIHRRSYRPVQEVLKAKS